MCFASLRKVPPIAAPMLQGTVPFLVLDVDIYVLSLQEELPQVPKVRADPSYSKASYDPFRSK